MFVSSQGWELAHSYARHATCPARERRRPGPQRAHFPHRTKFVRHVGARGPDVGPTDVEPDDENEDEVFVLEENDADEEHETSYAELYLRVVSPASGKSLGESRFRWSDAVLVAVMFTLVYGLVSTCARVMSGPYAGLLIDTRLSVLPWYAALSVTRMVLAYTVSLLFALVYAYMAYRIPLAAQLLMLIIDVLQSIPLFSFLPGVVLGLMALFPGARVGVELAAIFLLFTSMAWNMVLGFYQSLCGIPKDLQEASEVFRLSSWKRFWILELPAGAVGLIWNSIISVAGGWFFLISIESFELGNRDFRLPGLGSFLAAAAETADYRAIFGGLMAVVMVIVVTDFFLWRPLIAWSSKFTFSSTHTDSEPRSAIGNFLQRSRLARKYHEKFFKPAWEWFVNLDLPSRFRRPAAGSANGQVGPAAPRFLAFRRVGKAASLVAQAVVSVPFVGLLMWGMYQSSVLLSSLTMAQWLDVGYSSLLTFGRVAAALALSLVWTIPAGVAIGRDPKIASIFQPLVQIAASVPATALFPFLLLALSRIGGGLQIGSVALMMLGTMWYILFNVIAGAQAIPSEFFDVNAIYGGGRPLRKWRRLILPGIFPYLITGVVTAVGGAWNASIVSEYVVFRGGVLKARGLGCIISEAAASGNYPLLLAGTVVMSVLVLLTNRFVWGPLYKLAQEKYRIL